MIYLDTVLTKPCSLMKNFDNVMRGQNDLLISIPLVRDFFEKRQTNSINAQWNFQRLLKLT